jgi:hypothetical protein
MHSCRVTVQPYDKEDLPCLGQCMSGSSGQRGRKACHHRRRYWQCQEPTSRARKNSQRKRQSVRILHAWHSHGTTSSILLSLAMLIHIHRVFTPCYETRPNRQNTKSKKDATATSVGAQDTDPSSTPPRLSRRHPPPPVPAAKTIPQLSLPKEDAARQTATPPKSHLPRTAVEE